MKINPILEVEEGADFEGIVDGFKDFNNDEGFKQRKKPVSNQNSNQNQEQKNLSDKLAQNRGIIIKSLGIGLIILILYWIWNKYFNN